MSPTIEKAGYCHLWCRQTILMVRCRIAEADEFVSEIEMEDPKDEEALTEQLRRIAEDYRVGVGLQRGKLIKKSLS